MALASQMGSCRACSSASRRRGEPSLGVGLAICKLLVELHQGTIEVRSREGEGTTFIVTLPVLPT